MLTNYLVLLLIGFLAVALGQKTKEEVYRLALRILGAIALVWGFIYAPLTIQVTLEMMALSGFGAYRYYLKLSKC